MKRLLLLLTALWLFLPQSAHAQDILQKLKDEAMGFARGCDYVSYLNAAQEVADNWDFIKTLSNWKPTKKAALPVIDFIGDILQAGSQKAAQQSAEEQSKGLIYQLEQVCQIAMQVDETNRIHRIYQAGHLNIGNALRFLSDTLNVKLEITPGTKEEHLGRDYAKVYERMSRDPNFAGDTIYRAMHQSLFSTMSAADDMLASLSGIQKEILKLKDELRLRADPNKDGNPSTKWICPEGYPGAQGFNMASEHNLETDDKGIPICGPVPPGRSQQIMAASEIFKVQLMAIRQAAEARALEISAVGLMADNQIRRRDNYVDKTARAF